MAYEEKPMKAITGLHWSTRLTIVLVGTCLFFSFAFAFDFLISKMLGALAANNHRFQSTSGSSSLPVLLSAGNTCPQAPLSWLKLVDPHHQHHNNSSSSSSSRQQTSANSQRKYRSKLKVELEAVYELDLSLSRDESHFRLEDGPHNEVPVQPELKLSRMLDFYHSIIPFNPDIWLLSDPESQMSELLRGNLSHCLSDLQSILRLIGRKLDAEQLIRSREASQQDLNEPAMTNKGPPSPMSEIGMQNYRLMQLLDSFGRPEAGTLLVHPFWLGSYTQCKQVGLARQPLYLPGRRALRTRYCVGKLELNSWPIRSERANDYSIKVGLCLPESCDSLALFRQQQQQQQVANESRSAERQVERMRQQVQRIMLHNFNSQLYADSRLADIYCLPLDERRQLGLGAHLLLLFVAVWLSTCALCTWLRKAGKHRSKQARLKLGLSERFLEIMAIDVNIERFALPADRKAVQQQQQEQQPQVVNLAVLDSIKHIGCASIIAGHVLLTNLTLGSAYGYTADVIGNDLRTMLLLSSNNVVDTFFVISGMLVGYLIFSKLDKRDGSKKQQQQQRPLKTPGYLSLVGARYLRLAPLYFLVYAFVKWLSPHLGSGPLWDYATSGDSLRGLCSRESWIWPLAFISNFKPLAQHCIPSAWSIAADLQFFLILPPLIALLRRWPRFGRLLLLLLVISSSLLTYTDYLSMLDYVSAADFARLRLHVFTVLIKYAAHAYSYPQNRIGPTLIGLLGGQALYRYEVQRRSRLASGKRLPPARLNWPRWMRGHWFKAILVLCLGLLIAPAIVQLRLRARRYLAQTGGDCGGGAAGSCWLWWLAGRALQTSSRTDSQLTLVGMVLIKLLWSLCNCLILLRLCSDLSETLCARLMALPIWRCASKLNYAILLVHFEFIAYEAMSRLALAPITWTDLVCRFAFAYLCSLLAALPLYVLFEQPIQRLISWLLFERPTCAGGGGGGGAESSRYAKVQDNGQSTSSSRTGAAGRRDE